MSYTSLKRRIKDAGITLRPTPVFRNPYKPNAAAGSWHTSCRFQRGRQLFTHVITQSPKARGAPSTADALRAALRCAKDWHSDYHAWCKRRKFSTDVYADPQGYLTRKRLFLKEGRQKEKLQIFLGTLYADFIKDIS